MSRVLGRIGLIVLLAGPAAADWPCWRGANGNGTADPDCGESLVDAYADARLVWLSEARTYQAYPECLGGRPYLYSGQGGPVTADGKVFMYYFMPDGRVFNEKAPARFAEREFDPAVVGFDSREEVGRRYYGVTAEDVLLCCDAATGETLWQRNIPGGMNYGGRRGGWAGTKAGPVLTPCAAYGKVFFAGNTFRVFALHAATGETVWESNLGPAYERVQGKLREAVEARNHVLLPIDWFIGGHAPVFADGVVCFDDEQGSLSGGGLAAFDAETGQKLWSLPPGSNAYPGPVRWRHGQREFFISGRGALIEPRTGKVLWGPFGERAMFIAVSEQYLLTGSKGGDWECRFITPEGAELVWTRKGGGVGWCVPITAGGHVVWVAEAQFNCLDLKTGRQHRTTGNTVGGRTRGALVYSDGTVLLEFSEPMQLQESGWIGGGTRCKGPLPGHPGLIVANTTTGAIDDGYWYVRLADNIGCFQLRQALHARVRPVAGDVGALLDLLADPDPAVRVDAVVALRRTGDRSADVVKGLMAGLDNARYGAAAESARTLRGIDPPPPELVAMASDGGNSERRRMAVRALPDLAALANDALLLAASDPLCLRGTEAATTLAARQPEDLVPVARRVLEGRSRKVRMRLMGVLAANLDEPRAAGVLEVARTRLAAADAAAGKALIDALSRFPTDRLWAFFATIVEDRDHAYREFVLGRLSAWPGQQPLSVLKRICDDREGETKAVRETAFRAMIPMLTRGVRGKPGNVRAAELEAFLPVAEEFGAPNLLFADLAETKSLRGLCLLSRYVSDLALRAAALESIELCMEGVAPKDLMLSAETLKMLRVLDGTEFRRRVLTFLRRNRVPPAAADVEAIQALIEQADAAHARELLRGLAEVGSDAAWSILEAIVKREDHPRRGSGLAALGHWPGERPRPLLDAVLKDEKGVCVGIRRAAMEGLLGLLAGQASRRPAPERVALLEPALPAARELDTEHLWLAAVGRTGAPQAIDVLGRYFEDETLGDAAMGAVDACVENLARADMAAAAAKLQELAEARPPGDLRDALAGIAADLRSRRSGLPPEPAAGGDSLLELEQDGALPEGF